MLETTSNYNLRVYFTNIIAHRFCFDNAKTFKEYLKKLKLIPKYVVLLTNGFILKNKFKFFLKQKTQFLLLMYVTITGKFEADVLKLVMYVFEGLVEMRWFLCI